MTTVAIIDFAHSGTTMLAGICEILGVPMIGDNYHEWKWEDHGVIEAIGDGDNSFASLVNERNNKFDMWGFKYPGAWKFMPMLKSYLRNPVYMAIYKDPVSVTRRRFGTSDARFLRKLLNTARQMQQSINGIRNCGEPVMVFSYHKAIVKPRRFVLDVVETIGVEPRVANVETAVKFIQPNTGGPRRRYRDIEPFIEDNSRE